MAAPPAHHQSAPTADSDRSTGDLRSLDYNLAALCDHIQIEGFNSGAFSDVLVQAMGSTYHLHRLVLSRSSYFRNMLHGPWREASAPTLVLHIDDANVNSEAVAISLAYLYGHHPKLNDNNAFRVLAAASFLDLQDLCAICTDFIISELWTSNFLAYQVFAESQDYGIHGERVRTACWGYLCQSGTMELREVLPKLSSQTLHALLTSDELWVRNEEQRFELALYTLAAKAALFEADLPEQDTSSSDAGTSISESSVLKGKNLINTSHDNQLMDSNFQCTSIENNLDGYKAAQNILTDLANCAVDLHANIFCSKPVEVRDSRHSSKLEKPVALKPLADQNTAVSSCSYAETRNIIQSSGMGPSGESLCYGDIWPAREESRKCSSASSANGMPNDWGRCSVPPLWGGRIVGRRKVKSAKEDFNIRGEEYDTFINIFEGGSLLYCNMSFEALLNVRKQLESLAFPCKAVNDALWLQMLLCQRVQEIGADSCKSCSLISTACACRHPYGYPHGGGPVGYYRQEHDRNTGTMANVYVTDAQSEGNGLYGPVGVGVHGRGPIDGLAGIGRGSTFVSAAAWPPTRYVFSRVPCGLGNRNCQQSVAIGESEARVDFNGDPSGDGLTALVGLSQGSNIGHVPVGHMYDPDTQSGLGGPPGLTNATGVPLQMLEPQEHALGLEWESSEGSSISLDLKTPLRHFPPFRFGVEFEEVHMLNDGQVKHSAEVFYAGSLWKVSVQAFSDEDPQGRRTLGLFLHRRKAEATESLKKVHMYTDSREKVTARYQLICPSKREVMVFGSFKQAGTLLPKAPKGWGWRTALLFDELADLLQGGHPTAEKWPTLVNLPYWQNDQQHIQGHKYDNPTIHSLVSLPQKSAAYDLLSKMLEYDPRKRITALQALEHEYFRIDPLPGRNALVPSQPGEKVVNYPNRPVDDTTDFEGTSRSTNVQPSQQIPSGNTLSGSVGSTSMVGPRSLPRPMPPMVGMTRMSDGGMSAYNMVGLNPGGVPTQRGTAAAAAAQVHQQQQQQQLRRMQNSGYPQQKRRM